MIGAAIQRLAMVLALVGGLGELALDFGGVLLVLALPVGVLGLTLEAYAFHRADDAGVESARRGRKG